MNKKEKAIWYSSNNVIEIVLDLLNNTLNEIISKILKILLLVYK